MNIEKINRILAKWDPIGVGEDVAEDEYRIYLSLIIKASKSKHTLMNCLEDILINKLEVGYDSANKKHSEDLQKVCDEILLTLKKA